MSEWDGWACPGINCTDIDPKTGHGIIKFRKLNKKQRAIQNRRGEYYAKAFLLYSVVWFAAMFYFAIFDRKSDAAVGVIFLGMFGWMYAPFIMGEVWEKLTRPKYRKRCK